MADADGDGDSDGPTCAWQRQLGSGLENLRAMPPSGLPAQEPEPGSSALLLLVASPNIS